VLLKDLYFANGVALSANEDFVLVNETYRYRISRYWLKGEQAGTQDVFIDNLPGLPDNLQADATQGRCRLPPSPPLAQGAAGQTAARTLAAGDSLRLRHRPQRAGRDRAQSARHQRHPPAHGHLGQAGGRLPVLRQPG
jgi:hypothetical protein